MIIFLEEFRQLLKTMLKHQVDFILVGGYAVNYYGYNRPTGDMDIWLMPDNSNKERFISLLKEERFSVADINKIKGIDFTKEVAFHFGKPPKRIDFLTKISNVNFNDAWKEKKMLPMEDFQIPVLHLHHLISSKISSERIRDKADVEELQKIAKLKKKN
jgi:predicted nucleotidyltransferase